MLSEARSPLAHATSTVCPWQCLQVQVAVMSGLPKRTQQRTLAAAADNPRGLDVKVCAV